jgi:CheY-like chemotaxis protein
VRDEGAGIEPQMLARIFSPFVQQQSLARRGGLGLGLAIVKSLVELHDGQVTAFSEGPGKGSAFVVDLPLLAVPEPVQAQRGPGSGTNTGDKPADADSRILIVDDNVDAAETIGAVLRHLGYAVQITHDGPTALKAARAFKPNVCLLDIGLPLMSGYELARSLRQCEGLPADLRIIAVTGYGRDADRRRSEEAGFDDHVVKPADIDTIRRVLSKTMFGGSSAEEQKQRS